MSKIGCMNVISTIFSRKKCFNAVFNTLEIIMNNLDVKTTCVFPLALFKADVKLYFFGTIFKENATKYIKLIE